MENTAAKYNGLPITMGGHNKGRGSRVENAVSRTQYNVTRRLLRRSRACCPRLAAFETVYVRMSLFAIILVNGWLTYLLHDHAATSACVDNYV